MQKFASRVQKFASPMQKFRALVFDILAVTALWGLSSAYSLLVPTLFTFAGMPIFKKEGAGLGAYSFLLYICSGVLVVRMRV